MDGLELPELDLDLTEETPAEIDNAEVVDTPQDDNLEVDAPEEQAEGEEQSEPPPTDGRKAPDDVKKALKAFREASPENAKVAQTLNDAYFREQAYKAVFPSVKDAQGAHATIQTIQAYGGLDAVQSTIAEIEEVDALLQAGDPKAIDKIVEVSGEGFARIAPEMLNRLEQSNPEAYATAIRPHLVRAIADSNLSSVFGSVVQAMNFAQTPGASAEFKAKWEGEAKNGLAEIHKWLQEIGKPQAQQPQKPGTDGKLTEREQQLATREREIFNNEVNTRANAPINESMRKAVAPYVKGFNQEQRRDFVQAVYAEVGSRVKADKDYQTQKGALLKSKAGADRIAQLMASKFSTTVGDAAKAVKDAKSKIYGSKSAAATGTPGAKGAQGAPTGTGSLEKPILVKELPPRSDVDWDKTTQDMTMRGIRVLKSGKVVRLNR